MTTVLGLSLMMLSIESARRAPPSLPGARAATVHAGPNERSPQGTHIIGRTEGAIARDAAQSLYEGSAHGRTESHARHVILDIVPIFTLVSRERVSSTSGRSRTETSMLGVGLGMIVVQGAGGGQIQRIVLGGSRRFVASHDALVRSQGKPERATTMYFADKTNTALVMRLHPGRADMQRVYREGQRRTLQYMVPRQAPRELALYISDDGDWMGRFNRGS